MFTLDEFDPPIRLCRTSSGENEIRLPKEVIELLAGNWVWEIYLDEMSFMTTRMYIVDDELLVHLDDYALAQLGWQIGEEVTWKFEVLNGDEVKNEIRVVSSRQ